MQRWKRVVGIPAILLMVLAGCSVPTSSNSASTAGDTPPGMDAAKAYLGSRTANPTSIGAGLTPLPTAPPKGRKVIYLQGPATISARQSKSLQNAAQALGWDYSTVNTGTNTASAVGAFQAALARKPDAILFGGYPSSTFAKEIKTAKEEGIAVVNNSSDDELVDGLLANLAPPRENEMMGRLVAAYFVTKAGSKGQALLVNNQLYPILTAFVKGFQDALKEWCPECKSDVLNQNNSDYGINTPANVVAYLQRNPAAKWVVFSNGSLAQGVSTAVSGAGLQGVSIIGEAPVQANMANLQARTELAWGSTSVDILSWRVIDTLARQSVGANVSQAVGVALPAQMITVDNIGTVPQDNGFYIGVADYEQQFKKLWHVG
jgi:ribose transport system substrate-binding protein